MNSKFHSIFLLSVIGGTLGLAFADTVFDGFRGGIGFVVGLLASFVFFSVMTTVSEIGRLQSETIKAGQLKNVIMVDTSIENQVAVPHIQEKVLQNS